MVVLAQDGSKSVLPQGTFTPPECAAKVHVDQLRRLLSESPEAHGHGSRGSRVVRCPRREHWAMKMPMNKIIRFIEEGPENNTHFDASAEVRE